MNRMLVAALCAGLAGCASSSPVVSSSGVRDADSAMVTPCTYLGEVQGSSGWGNLAAAKGMENAKKDVREDAAKLGATHVVWANVQGAYTASASGKAYRC